jgi:glycosyltransferase involved in cell wall biosynthesis
VNLCFVSDYYPALPTFGGIAIYTQRIARALSERGHQVHIVVAKAGRVEDFEDDGVRVHYCDVHWIPLLGRWLPGLGESFGVARRLATLARQHRFDLIEVPNWEGIGLASTFMLKCPVVVRLHTSLAESVETAGRTPTQPERFMMWSERAATRRASAVVTHSQAHRDRMAAACGVEAIEVIPHGVPIPPHVTPPEGRTVLSIGRMNARKGMEDLFAAIPAVFEKVPGVRFQIVGVPPGHPAVQALLERFPDAVEALGMVTSGQLSGLYEQCAVYVSPALYESFGLTFAEAMGHGRPVVGCRASAVPEIVRDGVDGRLAPPRDPPAIAAALVELLLNEDARRTMGANARARAVENFAIGKAAMRTESFFQRVAGSA